MQQDNQAAPAGYDALHGTAAVVDLSRRGRMRFTGAKAGEVLTGLVTNDVLSLAPGQGLYAAALTPKGRIIADARILAGDGWYLADVPERARAGWNALIQKFVNPRLAKYVDESDATCAIGVFGQRAAAIAGPVIGVDAGLLAALPIYGHVAAALAEHAVTVTRVPDALVPGYEVIAPVSARDALLMRLEQAGAVAADEDTWTIARVEAGRPEWGMDMDDTTIPQEANLDELGAISYSKGCYTGQEVVARVHFRGHVNRHLRGLRGEGCAPVSGARLFAADEPGGEETEVGDIRTSVVSPRFGPIAIGMVRREVELQTILTARWTDGECRVRVVELPFGAPR